MKVQSLIVSLLALAATASADNLYHEPYRPQYHFSPKSGWIGDPSGLLHYQGKYHAYWWGKAESADLVHWQQVSDRVMRHDDKNISFFTGSMAIDRENTTGFGRGAWIAAYTSFENDSKKQTQSISWSRDGREFHWYDNNPVVDLWSSEFRDPTVFWHEATKRWVMVVAKALEKKVKIYSSQDMRQWTWESDFGPAGNSERSWECPDLFPLAVDGNPEHTKWVLLVSINWAQEQYFVGDFDGKRFTQVENLRSEPLYVDKGLDYYASRTFRDYDATTSEAPASVATLGWVATWDYAQKVPSKYGKGFWSIPRDYRLRTFSDGVRLVQTPIEALKQLRTSHVAVRTTLPVGASRLPKFAPKNNTYELDARFTSTAATSYGLNLCCGAGRMLKISYDTRSHVLLVDRTHCAAEPIEGFARTAWTRLNKTGNDLRLRIFVDKASVEIFADDGREVLTMQTFPADDQCGIETVALTKGVKADIDCWMMKSIWTE